MIRTPALLILAALIVGVGLGIAFGAAAPAVQEWAQAIGTLWLNALRMTIVPLIVALLVTGIAAAARAAATGRLAGGAVALMIGLLWCSAGLAAVVTPLLLGWFPIPAASAEALRVALSGAEPVGEVPGFAEFLLSLVPTNPVAAAANDQILPLILFTAIFALAVIRLEATARERLTGFFSALSDAMLVVIGWVLALAPVGVFALAFVVGAKAGTAAIGALLHYVLIVSAVGGIILVLAYALAVFAGRASLPAFARAIAPAQAVALSTQSSLASLPPMLRSSAELRVKPAVADIVLPLAVAIFRVTGPAMNLAVVIYVATWYGVELHTGAMLAGVAAAAITTLGSVSLPGQISFVTAIAPISIAMGVPIEPLALLIAVETFPDIMRTVANVTMDVAVTRAVAERVRVAEPLPDAPRDQILDSGR